MYVKDGLHLPATELDKHSNDVAVRCKLEQTEVKTCLMKCFDSAKVAIIMTSQN